MKRISNPVGALLLLFTFWGFAAFAASANGEENLPETVLQVPHKQKGVKTRLKIQPVETTSAPKKKQPEKSPKRETPHKEQSASRYVAVKTNAAYWGGAVANLSAEVQLHEHVSLELPLNWSLWDIE